MSPCDTAILPPLNMSSGSFFASPAYEKPTFVYSSEDDMLDSLLMVDPFENDLDMFNEFMSTMGTPTPTPVKKVISTLPTIANTTNFPTMTNLSITPSSMKHQLDSKIIDTVSAMTLPPMCVSPSPSDDCNKLNVVTPTKKRKSPTSPSNKKRRRVSDDEMTNAGMVAAAAAAVAVTATAPEASSSTECSMTARLERNREHAKKSRQRKKMLTQNLEQSLKELKEENDKLRVWISVNMDMNAEEHLETQKLESQERFMNHIKSNRVLDAKAIQFLQSLRKELP